MKTILLLFIMEIRIMSGCLIPSKAMQNSESTLESSFLVLYPTKCHLIIIWLHLKKLSKMTFSNGLSKIYTKHEFRAGWCLKNEDKGVLLVLELTSDFGSYPEIKVIGIERCLRPKYYFF